MKTEVITFRKETVYPCLKRSDTMIVLFTGPNTGICLKNDNKIYNKIGDKIEVCDEDKFTPLSSNEQLILSND